MKSFNLAAVAVFFLLFSAGCGSKQDKKSASDDSAKSADTAQLTPICPPETGSKMQQTVTIKYEGDCQYCSFIAEGG
ncbi:MAG: hypothetical protein ACRC3B_05580, partial [Bacteroidia bacterium]